MFLGVDGGGTKTGGENRSERIGRRRNSDEKKSEGLSPVATVPAEGNAERR